MFVKQLFLVLLLMSNLPCKAVISVLFEAISSVWVAVSNCKAVVFGSSMSNLVSNKVNSVITFVEPTNKFSAVNSP